MRGFLVEDFCDVTNFEKMVARAERSQLLSAALPCSLRNLSSVGTCNASVFFDVIEVAPAAKTVLDCPERALLSYTP